MFGIIDKNMVYDCLWGRCYSSWFIYTRKSITFNHMNIIWYRRSRLT